MDARFARVISASTLLVCLCALSTRAEASPAGYKTTNFVVSAPSPELAKEIGDQAEVYRRQLAMEWIGQELPAWSKPCPIHVQLANGAGGATSFVFDRGEVFGWKMNIQGSRDRLLDSVLPHEVTHTIFASHFRQPLPRWADEGACTTVEHRSEVAKQERNLIQYLKTGRGIPFSQMFAMKEYPNDVMPLYAQGHSLSQWLIESRGRKAFIDFLTDGMKDENWPRAVHENYGFDNLLTMQTAWNDWVKQGRPQLTPATSPGGALASNSRSANGTAATSTIIRGQSPDRLTRAAAPAPKQPAPSTAVTLASANASVYAAAVERAERERKQPVRSPDTAASDGASVYDASRSTGTLRR